MYKQKVSLNTVSAYKKLGRCVMWLGECSLSLPVRDSSFAATSEAAAGFAATLKNELLRAATPAYETLFSIFSLRPGGPNIAPRELRIPPRNYIVSKQMKTTQRIL